MTVDTVITNGTVVNPDGTVAADVAVDGEHIVAVGEPGTPPDVETTVNAPGRLVLPGVVDVHVHLDDMFSNNTYGTASKAAVLGGKTTFIDFAWQAWDSDASIRDKPGTLLKRVDRKQKKAADILNAITRDEYGEIPTWGNKDV